MTCRELGAESQLRKMVSATALGCTLAGEDLENDPPWAWLGPRGLGGEKKIRYRNAQCRNQQNVTMKHPYAHQNYTRIGIAVTLIGHRSGRTNAKRISANASSLCLIVVLCDFTASH